MFELLEKIRQKPDRTKKQIAFFSAFALSGIIFVVWLSVIFPSWKANENREAIVENLEPTPTSAIGSTFSSGFAAIGEQISNLKKVISSFSADQQYYSATSSENISTSSQEGL